MPELPAPFLDELRNQYLTAYRNGRIGNISTRLTVDSILARQQETTKTVMPNAKVCSLCSIVEGDSSRRTRIYYKYNGQIICNQCKNPINSYSTDVLYAKGVSYLPQDSILYGEELEISTGLRSNRDNQQIAAAMYDTIDSVGIIKYDGSVSSGFEIVSLPEKLNNVADQWTPVFDHIQKKSLANFRSSVNCGMHVHASKKFIDKNATRSLFAFQSVLENKPFIEFMGGRSLNGFCRSPLIADTCKSLTKTTLEYNLNNYTNSKYQAIAFHKLNTVEFRFFKSPTNLRRFTANVEFVDSLVRFAGLTPPVEMCYTNYLDWFFSSNKIRYSAPHLFDLRGKAMQKWLSSPKS